MLLSIYTNEYVINGAISDLDTCEYPVINNILLLIKYMNKCIQFTDQWMDGTGG